MEFRVLGPLEVLADGQPLELGGVKQRALLAILLLRANEVVARDVLTDELWGGRPPAGAPHGLDVHISRLRKALEAGNGERMLLTRRGGYVLRVAPTQLDLRHFERLLEEGRASLAADAPERAAAQLRDALGLWRGPALGDLLYEPCANVEAERLEELRLAALEERIEADLACGRHQALVGELELLVREYPLRERFRAQLMLALYRTDRQADALEVYRETRDYLKGELGLKPSKRLQRLEQEILEHDGQLEFKAEGPGPIATMTKPVGKQSASSTEAGLPTERTPALARMTSRRLLVAAAVVVTAVAAVLAGFLLRNGHGGEGPARLNANAVGVLDPAGNAISAEIPVGASPTDIAVGANAAWVTNADDHTVDRIDPGTQTVKDTIQVGSAPSGVAVGKGDIWVANTLDGTVSRIDARSDRVVQTIAVGNGPTAVGYGGGRVWVANGRDETLSRIDARTGAVIGTSSIGATPTQLAVEHNAVWVTSESSDRVFRVAPATGRVVQAIAVGTGPSGIAAGDGGVWVANTLDGTVAQIDPKRGAVTATIPVGGGPRDLTAGSDGVWVTNESAGSVEQLNVGDRSIAQQLQVRSRPGGIALVGGAPWVLARAIGTAHRGGVLRLVTADSDWDSIDTARHAFTFAPTALLGMTNDGLVTFEHVGGSDGVRVVPDLAVSLPVETNGGTSYTFRVRPGIRYSTGERVEPEDFRYALERVLSLNSPGETFYSDIVGARACIPTSMRCDLSRGVVTDRAARTVTFHLVAPDPDFLQKLAAFSFPAAVPAGTPMRDVGTDPLPATGPYMIDRYVPKRTIRLVRNPYFHEWSKAAQPAGYPDRIVWKFGISQAQGVTAIEDGSADVLENHGFLPNGRRHELETRYASQLHVNPALVTHGWWLNTRIPPFDSLAARRAVNYAFDRRAEVGFSGGPSAAQPTCQILPPHMPGYRPYCPYTVNPDGSGRWHGPDLAKARRLVAASHTRGMKVGILNERPIAQKPVSLYIVSLLRRLGYRASQRLVPESFDYQTNGHKVENAQVGSIDWSADYPAPSDEIDQKLSCESLRASADNGSNEPGFCDPSVDRHIHRAQALELTNPEQANRLWARIDRELTDQAPWVATLTFNNSDFVSKRVGNYQYNPQFGVLVDQLWVR